MRLGDDNFITDRTEQNHATCRKRRSNLFTKPNCLFFFLLLQLFGEDDPDQNVSPDTEDPEAAGDQAGEAAAQREGNEVRHWDFFSVSDPGPSLRIGLFFPSPDPDRGKIRIRKIRIRIHEKNDQETVSTSKTILLLL